MKNKLDHSADFTEQSYRQLLSVAKKNYRFITYQEMQAKDKVIIWRHDIDFSVHRALCLAKIEHKEGIVSTYFINPHSEFYNIFELEIANCIQKIVSLGHHLGLHFDPAFYKKQMTTKEEMIHFLGFEQGILEQMFKKPIKVYSFHNPSLGHWLDYDDNIIGNMINTYGKIFKNQYGYCSDSNGYWRFRRLYDVLSEAEEQRLQVLTHPGWWQKQAELPKARVARSIEGRRLHTMYKYNTILKTGNRVNIFELESEFQKLKDISPISQQAMILELDWLTKRYPTVFLELWRLFELKLHQFCRIYFKKNLKISTSELNLITQTDLLFKMHLIFAAINNKKWFDLTGISNKEFLKWQNIRDNINHGLKRYSKTDFEEGVRVIINLMRTLWEFLEQHPIHFYRTDISKKQIGSGTLIKWIEKHAHIIVSNPKELENITQHLKKELYDSKS